ncbi:hypothetical protein NDU88_001552 [Pleurodeles waltl]|uniref:Uncharacterized protein n=1 Tax=Pleurodeles waltl TaxID=8319 RepID=A0AAV7UVN1_PLEWA|nr:hypothetical protein NDU88_001552 [Pleurodeles waltl]
MQLTLDQCGPFNSGIAECHVRHITANEESFPDTKENDEEIRGCQTRSGQGEERQNAKNKGAVEDVAPKAVLVKERDRKGSVTDAVLKAVLESETRHTAGGAKNPDNPEGHQRCVPPCSWRSMAFPDMQWSPGEISQKEP